MNVLRILIHSKLHRPPLVENHVHRQHLLNQLDQRLQRPVTLVSAPAGYGKTSLVISWLEMSGSPNAWISLKGMVTRMYPGKPQFGRLNADERVDFETSIQIFTRNGAMAMEKESETGTIEPGKSADFIVINQNLLEIKP